MIEIKTINRDDYLSMWVVYEEPTDRREKFVARLHMAWQGGHGPTDCIVVGDTLDDVRDQLPPGMVNIGRQAADEPHIVEVWL